MQCWPHWLALGLHMVWQNLGASEFRVSAHATWSQVEVAASQKRLAAASAWENQIAKIHLANFFGNAFTSNWAQARSNLHNQLCA